MPPSNEPTQPDTTPTNLVAPTGTPEQPVQPSPPGKPKWPLVMAIIVAIIIAASAVYFLVIKPDDQPPASNGSQSSQSESSDSSELTVTSLTTTNSPNMENGTISFTHPDSWDVAKKTDQYGTEKTIITSSLGNTVEMYTVDSVGGTCEDDNDTYTLVKKITTQNAAYVFSEYQVPASWGVPALSLETNYDNKTAKHQALTEGQSNTNLCENLAGYPIAKDIKVVIKNSSGEVAIYDDIKDDTAFITMLQSFNVTDN